LVGNSKFVQERASILPIIPDRNEIKLHLWIVINGFGPPTALELGLTVGAPRRPEVNDSGLWRFDRSENGLVRRGFSTQGCDRKKDDQYKESKKRHLLSRIAAKHPMLNAERLMYHPSMSVDQAPKNA
jgi:hypothetical protein